MDDPRLSGWLDTIWDDLQEAAIRRRGDFRNATMASVSGETAASLRIVVLRMVDRATSRLGFHTDVRSEKVQQLLACPLGEVLFWRAVDGLQVRCAGRAELALPGSPEATAAFASMPEKGRRKYRSAPAPGTPIAAPESVTFVEPSSQTVDPGLARFTLVTFHVSRIDALQLDGSDQTRALFRLGADGSRSGTWIAP